MAGLATSARRRRRQLTVASAMLTAPRVHPPWTTLGGLREFFEDDHVHTALLVEGGKLLGTVERSDLAAELGDRAPALEVATLAGCTIAPHAPLPNALTGMRRAGRRRLAVTTADSTLLGLLCLKASGLGFCSDADVRRRRGAR